MYGKYKGKITCVFQQKNLLIHFFMSFMKFKKSRNFFYKQSNAFVIGGYNFFDIVNSHRARGFIFSDIIFICFLILLDFLDHKWMNLNGITDIQNKDIKTKICQKLKMSQNGKTIHS